MRTAPEGAAAVGEYGKCLGRHDSYNKTRRLTQTPDAWCRFGDVVFDILATTIARRFDLTRPYARVVAEAVLHDEP